MDKQNNEIILTCVFNSPLLVSGPDMLMVVTETCPPSTFTGSTSFDIAVFIVNSPYINITHKVSIVFTALTTLFSTMQA